MSTSALLRPQTDGPTYRRPSVGCSRTRLIAPNGHQIEPATALLNDLLNHYPALLLPDRHVIDRAKGHHPRRRTTLASAKSP